MKKLTIVCLLLFSVFTSADNRQSNKKNGHQEEKRHKPEIVKNAFDVLPLNSPVKESTANFLIKVNGSLEIDEVMYKIKNAGKIFEKPTNFQKAILSNGPEGKVLKVNVSKLTPGFYQLFVKIKDKKRNEHFFKTKYKDHAMFVIDSSLEVPMPDPKKNNATIAGVDTDNDGIRDDVQRWINEEFGDQPKVKMAMREAAILRQQSFLNVDDKNASILISKKRLDSNLCLYSIVGNDKGTKLLNGLKSLLLNTKDRIYTDIKINANFSGQSYRLPKINRSNLCNFDVDSF
ncbi:MAG: hypothetical protein L6Q33_07100 [Bacteriovoracaceae bacterium]|nr:hypothetical protein [Bacteriovoracaceae bacterium]